MRRYHPLRADAVLRRMRQGQEQGREGEDPGVGAEGEGGEAMTDVNRVLNCCVEHHTVFKFDSESNGMFIHRNPRAKDGSETVIHLTRHQCARLRKFLQGIDLREPT